MKLSRFVQPVCPIEILEPRIAPAAVIDIVTKNGSAFFKIFGDIDAAEHLSITGTPEGTLTIMGLNGETFRLNGAAGTGPITLNKIVGDVSVDLGRDADTLTIANLTLGGALKIKMGDGANTTTLTNVQATALSYTGGKDADSVTALGDVLVVAGKLTFSGGAGANELLVSAISARVGGDVSYTGGGGADRLSWVQAGLDSQAIIGGSVTMKGSVGPTTLILSSGTVIVGKNVTYLSGINPTATTGEFAIEADGLVRLGGKVNYSNPSGKQLISITAGDAVEIAGQLTIKARPLDDTEVLLGDSEYFSAGKITFFGKGGRLSARLDTSVVAISDGLTASGLKGIEVNAGGLIAGPVSLKVTSGGIALAANNLVAPLEFAGKVKLDVSTFNDVSSSLFGVRFLNTVTANLAVGHDTVTIDNITCFAGFTLNTGADADTISIETTGAEGSSYFYGKVSMNLGPATDTLTVGTSSADDRVYAARTFKISGARGEMISLHNGNVFAEDPIVV